MALIQLNNDGTRTIINEATLDQVLGTQHADASKQSARGTHKHEIDLSKVLKRAKTDLTGEFVAMEYDHEDGYIISSWLTKTKSNGNVHYQYIAFPVEFLQDYYYEYFDAKFTDLLKNYDVYFFCDCKSFRYHFSNRDNVNNILYKGGREDWKGLINYPVQGLFSVNPDKLGGLCKHLLFIVQSIFMTNWMSFKKDLNKLIKSDINLYELLTLNYDEEDIPEEIDKDVDNLSEKLNKLDAEYDNYSTQFDDILVDFNTGITDENYDDKADVFITEGVKLLKLMSNKLLEAERIKKDIFNNMKKHEEGSINHGELVALNELYEKQYQDLETMKIELEKFIDDM